jgi:hypothetical protein
MAEAIYLLCALTSVACAALLVRRWLRQRERLLLWSAACFAALAVNNCILFVDLVVVPGSDLTFWRNAAAFGGVALLLAGLIWETR